MQVSLHRRLLTISIACLALTGCPQPSPPPVPDMGPMSRCGDGPTRLTLGRGDPFEDVDPKAYTVDQGFQGGYHVDVSLRVVGHFDPDASDVDLALFEGERRIAHHITRDWYFEVNREAHACEYLLARLVLVDEEGGLMSDEAISPLLDAELRLEADIRSAEGEVRETYALDLTQIVLLR